MPSSLVVQNISLKKNQRTILEDVNFAIKKASLNMLIGHNGSGKSSLLRILSGLEKPTTGTVTFDNLPIAEYPRAALAKRLAWLGERLEIAFSYSLIDIMMMSRYPHNFGHPNSEDLCICRDLLEEFGLGQKAQSDIATLSSGELRKLMIAKTIAQSTEMIILDEPCANLDIASIKHLLRYLLKIISQRNRTVILSTHDIHVVQHYADHIFVLKKGTLASSGPAQAVAAAGGLIEFAWN